MVARTGRGSGLLAAAAFALTYALIVADRMHRTVAALIGAGLVVGLGLLPIDRAIAAVDFQTLGLLVGMMAIVSIASRSGLFAALAVKVVQLSAGRPAALFFGLAGVTAATSAFLDNVTTVLVIAPVTLAVAADLGLRPEPYLLAEAFAANIGGSATLVGDPPNIMIASAGGLGFPAFAHALAGIAAAVLALTLLPLWLWQGRRTSLPAPPPQMSRQLTPGEAIRDRPLLWRSLVVIGLVVAGFFLEGRTGMDSATVALLGATLLLALAGREAAETAIREVQWATILFFAALFVTVGALDQAGWIAALAGYVLRSTAGHPTAATLALLWLAGLTSSLVDNIPVTAAAIPLVRDLALAGAAAPGPLWWALSLGANLGGNATLIGASANVVVAAELERSGRPVSFLGYLRVAGPLTAWGMALATAYLYLCFLR